MPYIEFAYTDRSGTAHPAAVVPITNVRLQLDPPSAEMHIAIYHDAAALSTGKAPVEVRAPFALTAAEIEALKGQFALAAYGVLLARPEFSSGHIVT